MNLEGWINMALAIVLLLTMPLWNRKLPDYYNNRW